MGLQDEIEEIKKEIRETPYNKATQHHIGKLKAKLARLKDELMEKKSGGGSGGGFAVKKTGDATVVMVGYPSVGKSTLLNELTNAQSEVASYEFTTLDVVPGIMEYKNLKIQLVDLPGIIQGAASGKGHGKKILSMARAADLVLIVLDARNTQVLEGIREELCEFGLRLDQEPPRVKIKKKEKGGIKVTSTVKQERLSEEEIKGIVREYGIHSGEVFLYENVDEDRFIDALHDNRVYLPSLAVVNKIDLADEEVDLDCEYINVSAKYQRNLDKLREKIYEKLDVIRVYLKPQRGEPDMEEPLVLDKGSTIKDLCRSLHKDFESRFRYAKVWGENVKYQGQRKGLDHQLSDEEIVSIIKDR